MPLSLYNRAIIKVQQISNRPHFKIVLAGFIQIEIQSQPGFIFICNRQKILPKAEEIKLMLKQIQIFTQEHDLHKYGTFISGYFFYILHPSQQNFVFVFGLLQLQQIFSIPVHSWQTIKI
jgi:hypothetical protein